MRLQWPWASTSMYSSTSGSTSEAGMGGASRKRGRGKRGRGKRGRGKREWGKRGRRRRGRGKRIRDWWYWCGSRAIQNGPVYNISARRGTCSWLENSNGPIGKSATAVGQCHNVSRQLTSSRRIPPDGRPHPSTAGRQRGCRHEPGKKCTTTQNHHKQETRSGTPKRTQCVNKAEARTLQRGTRNGIGQDHDQHGEDI